MIWQINKEKDWYRRSCLIQNYHDIEKRKRYNKRGVKWTIKNTARDLELSIGYISESLKLARFDWDETEIDKYKITREQALKIIKSK